MEWVILLPGTALESHVLKWKDLFVLRVSYFADRHVIRAETAVIGHNQYEKKVDVQDTFKTVDAAKEWALLRMYGMLNDAREEFYRHLRAMGDAKLNLPPSTES